VHALPLLVVLDRGVDEKQAMDRPVRHWDRRHNDGVAFDQIEKAFPIDATPIFKDVVARLDPMASNAVIGFPSRRVTVSFQDAFEGGLRPLMGRALFFGRPLGSPLPAVTPLSETSSRLTGCIAI
jgi:hypothetical protein